MHLITQASLVEKNRMSDCDCQSLKVSLTNSTILADWLLRRLISDTNGVFVSRLNCMKPIEYQSIIVRN